MSWYSWVTDAYDTALDKGEAAWDATVDKVGDVKEYFVGEDEAAAGEVDGVPGTNGNTTGQNGGGSSGINWTAAGVVVGALTLASKFIK